MNDLKVIDNKLIPIYEGKDNRLVSARELHEFLKVQQDFSHWIKNQLEAVDSEEGKTHTLLKTSANNGGGTKIEYILTLDIAKEICMVAGVAPRTNKETKKLSKEARQYFIRIEKEFNNLKDKELKRIAQREAGKIVRNMLTDTIRDNIPDSPHKKFAYPNYTRLIYKILFNKTATQLREEMKVPKKKSLRDSFNPDELKEIQQLENIITGLISLGMGYEEIRSMLNLRYLKKIA